ncbi:ArsR/SmtB family transcription factor [Thermococcus argininiproducens]|uniref:ArsR/SmtB family transcription factor n=1 Tax=Thermococcus argininiproducens TaxID=2866384 RepID=UPI002072BDBD|nr:ArsR family transcriptional regulator [Thermococcus argininiproducens]
MITVAQDIERLAKKLDALGHPLRLRIVSLLARENRAMYLNEIANALEINRALAKVHLKKLKAAGIVKSKVVLDEERGKALRFYELVPFDLHLSPDILKEVVE